MAIDPTQRAYLSLGVRIMSDFGATSAVPVIVFVLIGQWLDHRYAAGSMYTIGAFVLSAGISGWIVYKKALGYAKEYEELNEKIETGD